MTIYSPISRQLRWTRHDEPPLNAPFTGEAKLMVEMDEFDPIDFFILFVNDDFLNVIVTETNRYAETRLANDGLPEFSRVKKWRPVDLEEMKVFFGLVIAMGLVQKNDIQDYWSVDETDETPFFSKHMSRDRFLLILSNIHLNNNGNAVPRGQVGFDPLFKLRPFIDVDHVETVVHVTLRRIIGMDTNGNKHHIGVQTAKNHCVYLNFFAYTILFRTTRHTCYLDRQVTTPKVTRTRTQTQTEA